MLIHCPHCEVSFSPRYEVCPKCKTFKASLNDRMEFFAGEAEVLLDKGTSVEDVEHILIEKGLPSASAREIVSDKSRELRKTATYYGMLRLVGGLGLLALGIVFCVACALVLSESGRINKWAIIFVVSLISSGIYLIARGGHNVISGRELTGNLDELNQNDGDGRLLSRDSPKH